MKVLCKTSFWLDKRETHLAIFLTIFFFVLSTAICRGSDTSGKSPGIYIDSIAIENNNIFDLDSTKYDFWLFRLANKLHFKTRRFVIKRELLQERGDLFCRKLADETERNLRSLSFLWDAQIELYHTEDGVNVVRVATSDTWTLLGGVTINRTARQTNLHLRFEELNLLGLGQYVSFNYFFRDFDDDYVQMSFLERRLFGSRLYIELFYNEDPEIGLKGFSIGKPFYALDSKVKYRVSYSQLHRRDDYYSSGNIIAQDKVSGALFNSFAAGRFGTYDSKVTVGVDFQYRDIDVTDEIVFYTGDNIRFPNDSLYYTITPEFGIYNVEYIKKTRINKFRKTEDMLFTKGGTIAFGWGIDGRDGMLLFRTAAISFAFATHFGANLVFLRLLRKYWFDGQVDFRKMANLSIRYYNNGLSWLTPMVNVEYSEDVRLDGMAVIYLGENNGLRGYPKNYSTGERRFVVNIENRIFPGIEFLSADFGAVQFIDLGQSWKKEEGFDIRNTLWSVGMGLRIGVERISNARMMRLDLAYAGKLQDWQLSFGLGQYIE